MPLLLSLLDFILMVINWAIVIQVILSWLVAFNVVNRNNQFVNSALHGLDRVTEPLYRPLRRILPDFGALDLAPLLVLLIIVFLRTRAIPYLYMATMTPAVI